MKFRGLDCLEPNGVNTRGATAVGVTGKSDTRNTVCASGAERDPYWWGGQYLRDEKQVGERTKL